MVVLEFLYLPLGRGSSMWLNGAQSTQNAFKLMNREEERPVEMQCWRFCWNAWKSWTIGEYVFTHCPGCSPGGRHLRRPDSAQCSSRAWTGWIRKRVTVECSAPYGLHSHCILLSAHCIIPLKKGLGQANWTTSHLPSRPGGLWGKANVGQRKR